MGHGPTSQRGPLLIGCLWILQFLISAIWVRTNFGTDLWPWSVSTLILHCLYALSLVPDGKAVFTRPRNREEDVSLIR